MSKVESKPLEVGRRNFSVIGKVRLPKEGLANAEMKEGSTWLGVRTGFSVETEEGNLVYCTISGGRSMKSGVLYAQPKESGAGMVQIPFADRDNPDMLAKVADFSFLRANLSDEGNEFKTIDTLDYLDYLKEHLVDGLEVFVKGYAEYSEYEKDGDTIVYRNLKVNNIFLNEKTLDDNGDEALKYPKSAILKQTYIFTNDSLNKRFAKELEENGETLLSVYVPQYVSSVKSPSGKYVQLKKVLPLPQTIIYRISDKEKSHVDKHVSLIEKLFKCKRDEILEQDLIVAIKEGYVAEGGEIEISKEMQTLIDEGLISIEDIQQAPTIRSTRRNELEYLKFALMIYEDGKQGLGSRDKYNHDIFERVTFDDDNDDDWESEPSSKSVSDNEMDDSDNLIDFDALFD